MPWIWPKTLKKSEAVPQCLPVLSTAGNASPWWQAFLQWKAPWLLAGTPLVWLNGCQLCQGDGRACISPLIETSPSGEQLTLREQDLCQSTSNLLPNRWKQPKLRWHNDPTIAGYRSKEWIMLRPDLHQRREMFCWKSLPTIKLSKVLWANL